MPVSQGDERASKTRKEVSITSTGAMKEEYTIDENGRVIFNSDNLSFKLDLPNLKIFGSSHDKAKEIYDQIILSELRKNYGYTTNSK